MKAFTRSVSVPVLALLILAATMRVDALNNFGPRDGGGQEASSGPTNSSGGAQDPGPRAGAVNAGAPLSTLTPAQLQFF